MPLMSGSDMSMVTKSGLSAKARLTASAPLPASPTAS